MRVIHEKDNKAYQQVIYYDDDNGMYYELIRYRGGIEAEVYTGQKLTQDTGYFYADNGREVAVKPYVNAEDEPDSNAGSFPVRKGERWKTIKERLPGYLIRMKL